MQPERLVLRFADLGTQGLHRLLGRFTASGALAQTRLQGIERGRPFGQFSRDFHHLLVGAAHFLALHTLTLAGRGNFLVAAGDGLTQLLANLAIVCGAALRLHHAVADGLHGLAGGFHLMFQLAQAQAVAGDGGFAFLQSGRGFIPAGLERSELLVQVALQLGDLIVLAADEIEFENFEVVGERLVAARFAGLALERANLALHLAHDVVDAHKIRFGVFEFAQGFLLLRFELGDAGRLFEDRTAIFRTTAQDQVDLALLHDGVAAATDAGIHEKVVDVAQPARRFVEQVFAFAVAEDPARHAHFLVIRAEMLRTTAECEGNLRHANCRAGVRAAEDDIRHFAAAQRFRRLLTQAPADGIKDVRLAAAVRADHRSDAFVKFQVRLVDERLKT